MRRARSWKPSDEQMRLWPGVSGNTINGLGETTPRPPSPIYWHPPERTPHGPLQRWFYTQSTSPLVDEARKERQKAIDAPLSEVAATPREASAEAWTAEVKRVALESGADVVGIAAFRPEWVFAGSPVPPEKWIVVLGVGMSYEAMRTAPEAPAAAEVSRTYGRGTRAAKGVANFLREAGHPAEPHGGPMAGAFVLIPAAIAAGLGELGKHGSLIHRDLGASFRLACVLTDVPLVADAPDVFGGDDFCQRCSLCVDECPPDAIFQVKQDVRGEHRWYVDFDKCLPFFNEHMGCAICVAVCPWSRPGVATRLAEKMAVRKAR